MRICILTESNNGFDARVHVHFGSAPIFTIQLITDDGEVWGSQEVFEKLKQKLKEYYLMRVDEKKHGTVRFVARGGIPWIEILRVARKEKVDLIVLGPYTVRGSVLEHGTKEPHLRSNAQEVSIRSRCPVSIVASPKQIMALEEIER
jgi:nucleotide-binding universal stress UspA family protein